MKGQIEVITKGEITRYSHGTPNHLSWILIASNSKSNMVWNSKHRIICTRSDEKGTKIWSPNKVGAINLLEAVKLNEAICSYSKEPK